MTDARQTPPALSYRSAEIRADGPMADDCDEIEVVYSAGADVERGDWTGFAWIEALRVDADAIDDTRIQAGMPLLRDHDAGSVDSVVGVTVAGSHKIEGGAASVRVRLSRAASCADVVTKIRERVLRSISVGYRVDAWEVDKPKGGPERRTATRWTPMEISVVPVPADAAAHIRAEQPRPEAPMHTDTAPAVDAAAIRKQAIADAAQIRTLADSLGLGAVGAKLAADPAMTLDLARAQLLDAKVAADAQTATRGQTRISVGTEDRDHMRQGVKASLWKRSGSSVKLSEQDESLARQWMGLSMAQIARNMLRGSGSADVDYLSDEGVLKLALRAQSSSDFPLILQQVVDKSLLAAYAEQPKAYQSIAAPSTVSNLRARRPTILSGTVALDTVVEGADYPNRPLAESQETYSLAKRGQIIALTLEALLKDDLGAFGRIPAGFAAAAIRAENSVVFGLLNANAAMSDGVALFHATHANLAGSGAAPSAASLSATDTLIRKQTGVNGEPLNIWGKKLVVPVALYHATAALFSPRYTPTAASGVLAGGLDLMEVVTHPVLDGTSAVVWYLLADPMVAPVLEYCTPSDTPALSLEEHENFSNDTKEFKVRHWFGAGVVDHRGGAKNPGA